MGANDDEDVKGFNCFRVDVKRKSIEDKIRREKVFDVDEALDIENSRASSFQVREIHVDETKVNTVRDWSSPKTLPEYLCCKDPFSLLRPSDELEYAEPLDGEAEQVTYVVQRTLYSPKSCENLVSKALVKAFKLPTEPHQIGWIKEVLALKVTEICKVPLAIGKHYNDLVTCDVVDMEAYYDVKVGVRNLYWEDLYECLVKTRNGWCAKKNMGSRYHVAQDIKGTA
ncbi:hypothetical protein Tco_1436191 [Tanacetum coccineum]